MNVAFVVEDSVQPEKVDVVVVLGMVQPVSVALVVVLSKLQPLTVDVVDEGTEQPVNVDTVGVLSTAHPERFEVNVAVGTVQPVRSAFVVLVAMSQPVIGTGTSVADALHPVSVTFVVVAPTPGIVRVSMREPVRQTVLPLPSATLPESRLHAMVLAVAPLTRRR